MKSNPEPTAAARGAWSWAGRVAAVALVCAAWSGLASARLEAAEGGLGAQIRDLAAADLFLLTSRWEALPITIVEAFRASAPAVARLARAFGLAAHCRFGEVHRVIPCSEVGEPRDAVAGGEAAVRRRTG